MREKKHTVAIILITVLLSVVLTICGMTVYLNFSDKYVVVDGKTYSEIYNFAVENNKLYSIEKLMNEKYLWSINKEKMVDTACKAMVGSLGDIYSEYLTKDESKALFDALDGEFTGIGVAFIKNADDEFQITEIIEGSPASESKLTVGDILTKIDGKTYDDSVEMARNIRGELGTTVKVEYVHKGEKKTTEITRGVVEDASVKGIVLDENIGYINIASFDENTAEQFKNELDAMEAKKPKGLIIDLRNNAGGYVEQGIEIADMLLPECNITYTEDKAKNKENFDSDVKCTKLKYVFLVNGNTASTSEILAAAIKDNKGGKIVGENTFGKGIIQNTIPFEDGSALKLTVMQFFSPNGETIHKKGVKPDYEVKLKAGKPVDYQLKKAIDLLD